MAKILYFGKNFETRTNKKEEVMHALIKFVISIDSAKGILSTLDDIKAKAERIYNSRIKNTADLNRFYNNLKKAGV